MKHRIKSKSLKYSVPTDAKEVAWMAFVVWRDPKDGHGHVTVPWQVRADVTPEDAELVSRLEGTVCRCMRRFAADERKRRARNPKGSER